MKIKVSKNQWEEMGKVGGWLKEAQTQMTQTMPLDGVQNAEDSKADFKQVAKKEEVKEAKKGKPVNPWAVCHTTVDKDKNPDKFEKCVMDIKAKHPVKKD